MQQLTYNLGTAAQGLAGQPYTPNPVPAVATPSATTQAAWNLAGQHAGAWGGTLNNAEDLTAAGANQIAFNPLATPDPITANKLTSSDINQYLNPFTNSVVGALTARSNENLFQNVLPGIQDKFVFAGQSRSPQEAELTEQALKRSQDSLNQQIANTEAQGYQNASTTAAQQQGFTTGVQQQQQDFLTKFGQQQQGAALGVQQANQQRQIAAGAQLGQLGALTQQLGAGDVGQLAAAGQAQDVNNQANLNAARQDFVNQQQWPYQNLGFASSIVRGLPVNTNQQTVGSTYNVPFSPSPLSTGISATLLAKAFGLGARRGGHVRRGRTGALSMRTA